LRHFLLRLKRRTLSNSVQRIAWRGRPNMWTNCPKINVHAIKLCPSSLGLKMQVWSILHTFDVVRL